MPGHSQSRSSTPSRQSTPIATESTKCQECKKCKLGTILGNQLVSIITAFFATLFTILAWTAYHFDEEALKESKINLHSYLQPAILAVIFTVIFGASMYFQMMP